MFAAFLVVFLSALIVFFSTNKRYRWFYIISKTYRRDIRAITAFYKVQKYSKRCLAESTTIYSEFASTAQKNPDKVAFYFEDQVWTYKMMEELVNRIGRFFHMEGFKKGDTVALLLENRPEYPALWIGVSQLGVRTALINTNLCKDPLLYCLNTVNSQAVIFGSSYATRIADIRDFLKDMKLYEYQENANLSEVLKDSINLKLELQNVSGEKLEPKLVVAKPQDPLVYIYTSGTTGLPKAAVLTNIRCLVMLKVLFVLSEYRSDDIAYVPLPLYHVAGGMGGVAQTLVSGVTCVLARKFSASKFFVDCEKYKVTVTQYIGEICRYLMALPEDTPINHNIRSMCGNGLRPQMWDAFIRRFKIKQVLELYAATEGISNMLNIDNTPGAIGFVPRYLRYFYPVRLIKCDDSTGAPIRNAKGFCIECGVDEPGLAIGKINPKKIVTNFEGYTDKEETEKKILSDVFDKGDMYFNSGDLLVYDELGYFYFKDRTGDTFRWKGENVSTSEVESIISSITEHADVVVYGVEVPHTDGKAGMAALVEGNKNFNIDQLCEQLRMRLPSYAVPVFIRLLKSMQLTGTYKLLKTDLKMEGFDINKINDIVYFYNSQLKKYVKLNKEIYEEIVNGTIRV